MHLLLARAVFSLERQDFAYCASIKSHNAQLRDDPALQSHLPCGVCDTDIGVFNRKTIRGCGLCTQKYKATIKCTLRAIPLENLLSLTFATAAFILSILLP